MQVIREASPGDVAAMAGLMARRREEYERYQPVFWRRAPGAADRHAAFLAGLVGDPEVIVRVCERDGRFAGFAIASLVPSPPVYDPGGPTCTIDDYAVVDDRDWASIGVDLLRAVTDEARARGAAQVVVVCGHADQAKREALRLAGLSIASEWWTAPL
ncbi:GNAT family N-acetyltransferase [Nonomuraea rubra]|uniref:GNAT superfamily N-acetyltransferase n=1 Tax=Nonomuraea rubra TaxID=46180 RepID=A0A7X0NTL9_9ACTN|nr:GNAT family N-acetyltransferase [Nonomuraea rubra]MBB6549398.1 GNAT superfamily N-acetyltransferase [Nonomuraea rubra]